MTGSLGTRPDDTDIPTASHGFGSRVDRVPDYTARTEVDAALNALDALSRN